MTVATSAAMSWRVVALDRLAGLSHATKIDCKDPVAGCGKGRTQSLEVAQTLTEGRDEYDRGPGAFVAYMNPTAVDRRLVFCYDGSLV